MTPEFDIVVVTTREEYREALPCDTQITRRTVVLNSGSAHIDTGSCPPRYRRIWVGHNAGWFRAANAGLSLATAPHVVLCNDDITVRTDGWLEKLREPFLADLKIAAVGPRSSPNQGRQGKLEVRPWRYCYGEYLDQPFSDGGWLRETSLLDKDEGCWPADFDPDAEWGIGSWPLSFFCVMFSQEALLDVGLLDLQLADGYGGDDDDWLRRAWEKGWRFAYQPEVLVEHEGNATFGKRKGELQARNVKYLRRKWGRE